MNPNVLRGGLAAAVVAAVWFVTGSAPGRDVPPEQPIPAPLRDGSFFRRAYEQVGPVASDGDVRGLLVNHHLLAPHLIAQAMNAASTGDDVTVILIAPDHFGGGAAPVTTTMAAFDTPFGQLMPVEEVVQAVVDSGYALDEREAVVREHGLTNIVPFIRYSMPRARIVPLMVRDTVSVAALNAMTDALGALEGRVIVIGSFDFTHDATMAEAEMNDALSLSLIEAFDDTRSGEIEVDSKAGVALLLRLVRRYGAESFTVFATTNSARLLGDHSRTDVTSYITGTFR